MRTIALETSAQPGGIALLCGDNTVFETSLPQDKRTTQSFAGELQMALRTAGWRAADVDLFAVCEGPGSFTGLRIGVTAAKTFAYATGCQLAAVDTLSVIASQFQNCALPIWSVLDAQRRQLFVAQFQPRDGQLDRLAATHLVRAEEWLPSLGPDVAITGPGLRNWHSNLPEHVHQASEVEWTVRPSQLGRLAVAQMRAGRTANMWKLVPNYYRQSAAEERLEGSE